jgi:glutathione synthase/RimK-type ligase-like ATP-grasp enzyme
MSGDEMSYPVVVRPNRHQGGNDFYLLESEELLAAFAEQHNPRGWYVSEFYDKRAEFRVHAAHGRVLLVNSKVARPGEEHIYDQPIWNHAINNFYFKVVKRRDWMLDVVRLGIRATQALGLDYAAVDIMAGDGDPVVCEVNTTPTTVNYSSEKYAVYFDWLVRTGGRHEHFPMPPVGASYEEYVFDYTIGG